MRKYSSPANRQTRTPAKKTPSKGGRSKGANSNPASKDITTVVLGSYIIQPWYASSYPKKSVDEACASHGRIYVCERCFKYTPDTSRFVGHQVTVAYTPLLYFITQLINRESRNSAL
jgi:hypothetical protein